METEVVQMADAKTQIEELDVEEFARSHAHDCEKPDARFYIIRIDRERKRVSEPELTGREILALVGKTPETHRLYQKFRSGKARIVEPCDVVNFRRPGVERFQTIPLDPVEGTADE